MRPIEIDEEWHSIKQNMQKAPSSGNWHWIYKIQSVCLSGQNCNLVVIVALLKSLYFASAFKAQTIVTFVA